MGNSKDTVVFRKFLSDGGNAFVSVIANEFRSDEYNDCSSELVINDGNDNIDFYYSFNQRDKGVHTDERYKQAIDELEAIKFAVEAMIEETATAYMNTRQGELDLEV